MTKTANAVIKAAPSTRALKVREDSFNEEARTIDVIFASENPVDSWLPQIGEYKEVLDCTPESCDMFRLLNGAQFLKEHDRHLVVGVVENARFEDRLGIATMRYAKTALGEEEFQMAKDNIRRNFSVSFTIRELTLESASEEDGDVYRATGWEPNEISVVSVEADTNCKALRSRAEESQPVKIELSEQMKLNPHARAFFMEADKGENGNNNTQTIDVEKEREKLRAEMLKTNQEIRDAAALFEKQGYDVSKIRSKAENEGWTIDKFRAEAISVLNEESTKRSVSKSNIEVVGERQVKSLGEFFVQDQEYKNQRHSKKRAVSVEIKDACHFRATASTSTITNYSGIVHAPGPIEIGVQQATVADLLSQGTTDLNAIPYLQEDTLTNAATTVAEGGTKPEITWDWSQTSAPVKKIAVTSKVTDELFADVPSMQSYVDSRMRYMVEITEDAQLLTGDGIGSNITGITATSGIQTQALGADTKLDAIRKAITKVQSTGFFTPDGIVMHPNDWEEISLMKDANNQYYAGGPFFAPYGNGGFVMFQRLWGLPVVVTTSMTQNTALVGAFKLGAMIFRRMGITLDSTNSNEDDYKKNLICLRAEERLALAVWRPKAFCTVTGI